MSRQLQSLDAIAQSNTTYSLSHDPLATPAEDRSIDKDDKEAADPDTEVEENVRQDDGVTRIEALCKRRSPPSFSPSRVDIWLSSPQMSSSGKDGVSTPSGSPSD
jgi:hypothetical protein